MRRLAENIANCTCNLFAFLNSMSCVKSVLIMKLYKKAFNESSKIRYKSEKNLMEFIGYLTLQTVVGEKEKALAEFKKLKEKNLTESEKQYINSIEPIIRNYKGGGYNGIFRNK